MLGKTRGMANTFLLQAPEAFHLFSSGFQEGWVWQRKLENLNQSGLIALQTEDCVPQWEQVLSELSVRPLAVKTHTLLFLCENTLYERIIRG